MALRTVARTLSAALALTLVAACEKKTPPPSPQETVTPPAPKEAQKPAAAEVKIDESLLPAFGALPKAMESKDNPITPEKVALGRELYAETAISAGKDLSCNSCHRLDKFGVDGEKTSEGHKKQRGARNSPTVYNAAGHFVQFWDGRAKTVEDQAKGPVLNPVEMAMADDKAVVTALRAAKYEDKFKKAFPGEKEPLTFDNFAKAVGAFERTLVTPSRWDKFLGGEKDALTPAEKAGFKTFTDTGCNSCHTGPYVGGGMYQKLGLAKAWPGEGDLGRYAVTKQDADKLMFKVPSLRNVRKTAPYFHDGSVATLEEAIKLMARHQLGKELGDAEVTSIAAFLDALTGEVPAELATAPATAADGGAAPAKSADGGAAPASPAASAKH